MLREGGQRVDSPPREVGPQNDRPTPWEGDTLLEEGYA